MAALWGCQDICQGHVVWADLTLTDVTCRKEIFFSENRLWFLFHAECPQHRALQEAQPGLDQTPRAVGPGSTEPGPAMGLAESPAGMWPCMDWLNEWGILKP